ncbi:PREDICTED: cytosolic Fe-S cluster assembly factor narfl-like isoform X2 [Priapulus caudatus]|uniref:Cytosolic Fe-S cluster assembly factor narfl-like isoform X2 n=1 Tax=Priapulus caudatus TaxID=37621 RepID=A0ABM1E879_PRICU|nr:PREDICTED: cytosolic Fe-S cluster assembly factor narfl-like isoform X2 [Priapulus caudatus]
MWFLILIAVSECIKPVKIERRPGKTGAIKLQTDGTYMQVDEEAGVEVKLEKAKITLNDCLACSGCITSAESVLITQQSQEELYRVLSKNQENRKFGIHNEVYTVVISISPQSRASLATKYGLSVVEAARKLTGFFKKLGCDHVFDTTFARDFSLIESQREFVQRYRNRNKENKSLPMLASACPGWVCYAEKTHGSYILPYISTTKSPQQIMGSLVKDHFSSMLGTTPERIFHVTVMPCYDKKLEASREDFYSDVYRTRDVNCVLSTGEVDAMSQQEQIKLNDVESVELDNWFNCLDGADLVSHDGGGSGGYLEHVIRYAAKELFQLEFSELNYKTLRNEDFREVTVEQDGKILLRCALAYGFRNIQNVVQKLKRGKCVYDFIEVMACPVGCLNGGGQIRPPEGVTAKELLSQVSDVYGSVNSRTPTENAAVAALYGDWLGGADSEKCHNALHTNYHQVEKMVNALNIKW